MQIVKLWLQLAQILKTHEMQQNFNNKLTSILKNAQSTHNYKTILYAANEKEATINGTTFKTQELLKIINSKLTTPVILFNQRNAARKHLQLNEKLLNLVEMQVGGWNDRQLLTLMWSKIKQNTQSHTILLFGAATVKQPQIRSLMKYCVEHKAMNIIAFTQQSMLQKYYYTLKLFPKFGLKRKILGNGSEDLFPDHVKNMAAHPLKVLVPNVIPKSYFFTKPNGKRELSGYIGKLFVEYAKKHNATLSFPVWRARDGGVLSPDETDRLVVNNSVDAAAELAFARKKRALSLTRFYDFFQWCVMVPVEQPLPNYLFYWHIYDATTVALFLLTFMTMSFIFKLTKLIFKQNGCLCKRAFWLKALQLDVHVLNGFLGQSFVMKRPFNGVYSAVCLLICFAGLIFNVTFTTYLQAYKTSPPTGKPLNTVEDLQRNDVKILIQKKAFRLALDLKTGICQSAFKVITSYDDYVGRRNEPDTKYAFSISSPNWVMYQEQQNFFERPRFRFSNICLERSVRVLLPLQLNSIYLKSMNIMVGRVRQAGLVEKWKRQAFYELLAMRRFRLIDPSRKKYVFVPVELCDLYAVFGFFIASLIVASVRFLMEVFLFKKTIVIKSKKAVRVRFKVKVEFKF